MKTNTTVGNLGRDGAFYDHEVRVYNRDLEWNADRLFLLFCEHLKTMPNSVVRVLETGIGTGRFANEFLTRVAEAELLDCVQYAGADYSATQLAQARETLAPFGSAVSLQEANVLADDFFESVESPADIVTNSSFLNYVPPAQLPRYLQGAVACLQRETDRVSSCKSLAFFHACNAESMRDLVEYAEALLHGTFQIDDPMQFRTRFHHNVPENTIESALKALLPHATADIVDNEIPMRVTKPESWIDFWATGYQTQLAGAELARFNAALVENVRAMQSANDGLIPCTRRASIFKL